MAAVFRRRSERLETEQENANLRAGLIAATVANVHRRRGARSLKPSDFFRSREDVMTVEEAVRFLDRWADVQNRRVAEGEAG